MNASSSQWAGVLPLAPIIRHFFLNVWHLRFVLLALIALLVAASFLLLVVEGESILPGAEAASRLKELFFISAAALFPVNVSSFKPATDAGRLLTLVLSSCGYFLLGLVVWLVQTSMTGLRLKVARYCFFPTDTDL